jgi:2-(1,2-epoxy-1,2-dihydrophenyl)acetyl-CoA isomerase
VAADQESAVRYEVDAAVATITMVAPALGRVAKESLLEAVHQAAGDPRVRAVVLTGSGRSFCAGQDLREHAEALESGPEEAFATLVAHFNPVITSLSSMAKPVLSLINGSCAGAGLGLALACDVRMAAAGARFSTAFTNIGLTPDSGLSASLSRAVGQARASELILLAQPFTAEEALAWGLVGSVVPGDQLAAAGWEVALRLAAGPTQAYATAKRAIRRAWGAPLAEVLEAEAEAQHGLGATADHRGAVQAFLAKRPPEFNGN